jgi:hypothetical protein
MMRLRHGRQRRKIKETTSHEPRASPSVFYRSLCSCDVGLSMPCRQGKICYRMQRQSTKWQSKVGYVSGLMRRMSGAGIDDARCVDATRTTTGTRRTSKFLVSVIVVGSDKFVFIFLRIVRHAFSASSDTDCREVMSGLPSRNLVPHQHETSTR